MYMVKVIFSALMLLTLGATSSLAASINYALPGFSVIVPFNMSLGGVTYLAGTYDIAGNVRTDGTIGDIVIADNIQFVKLSATNSSGVLMDSIDYVKGEKDVILTALDVTISATASLLTISFTSPDGELSATDSSVTAGLKAGSIIGFIGFSGFSLEQTIVPGSSSIGLAIAPVPVPAMLPAMIVALGGLAVAGARRRI